jgi:hypothetical protein
MSIASDISLLVLMLDHNDEMFRLAMKTNPRLNESNDRLTGTMADLTKQEAEHLFDLLNQFVDDIVLEISVVDYLSLQHFINLVVSVLRRTTDDDDDEEDGIGGHMFENMDDDRRQEVSQRLRNIFCPHQDENEDPTE